MWYQDLFYLFLDYQRYPWNFFVRSKDCVYIGYVDSLEAACRL